MAGLFSLNQLFKEPPYKKIILSIISKTISSENIVFYYSYISPFFENSIFDIDSDKKPPIFYAPFAKKYEFMNSILSNIFLKESQKSEILKILFIFQKGINGIRRFIYLYRYKKSRIYNTTDLCGDPIPENPRLSITIFQNNTRYCFLLREVMKIIISGLSNSVHFFSEPIPCKNPYTNIPFNKSALYNIYFAIRFSSSLKIPELFHRYFLLDFHLYDFLMNSDEEIREEYLKSYVKNIGNYLQGEIRMIVHDIFRENRIFCIHINKEFPEDRLLAIMRPYIELYYKVKYSLKRSYSRQLSIILRYSLLQFVKYNRFFGRKVSKRENTNGRMKWIVDFNDKHIAFQLLNGSVYEESHLSCFSDIISKMVREIRELKKIKFFSQPVPTIGEDAESDDTEYDDQPHGSELEEPAEINEEDHEDHEDQDDEDHEDIFDDDEIRIIVTRDQNTPVLEEDSEYDSVD